MNRDCVQAVAHWRRMDREGTDRCTLARAAHGWILSGQAKWNQDGPVTLNYVVRCDENWNSLSADITGTRAGARIALRVGQGSRGWSLNGRPQNGTLGCRDIDLCFTPATNLLPLRRLDMTGGEPVTARAVWLVPELDRLQRLDQTYARLDDGSFAYASPGFAADLTVDRNGFVTRYPGLWEGWVDA